MYLSSPLADPSVPLHMPLCCHTSDISATGHSQAPTTKRYQIPEWGQGKPMERQCSSSFPHTGGQRPDPTRLSHHLNLPPASERLLALATQPLVLKTRRIMKELAQLGPKLQHHPSHCISPATCSPSERSPIAYEKPPGFAASPNTYNCWDN